VAFIGEKLGPDCADGRLAYPSLATNRYLHAQLQRGRPDLIFAECRKQVQHPSLYTPVPLIPARPQPDVNEERYSCHLTQLDQGLSTDTLMARSTY
jgi:hypothetical protein